MLSEHRDLAARAFFRSAQAVTGVTPDRVTTDGNDAYSRAIRTELGKHVRHRTSRYLNTQTFYNADRECTRHVMTQPGNRGGR
jgi:putative transposase